MPPAPLRFPGGRDRAGGWLGAGVGGGAWRTRAVGRVAPFRLRSTASGDGGVPPLGSLAYVGGARLPPAAGPCAPATRRSLGLRLASLPADGEAAPAHAPRKGTPPPPLALEAPASLRSYALQASNPALHDRPTDDPRRSVKDGSAAYRQSTTQNRGWSAIDDPRRSVKDGSAVSTINDAESGRSAIDDPRRRVRDGRRYRRRRRVRDGRLSRRCVSFGARPALKGARTRYRAG